MAQYIKYLMERVSPGGYLWYYA